jgi:hypothetical protein
MACLAALCIASQDNCSATPANTVISSLGNPGSAIVNDNVSCTFGYSFTLGGADASLTQLGVWDQGNDGLAEGHSVGLWTSTGTLLASAIVPSGTSASLYNGFRYIGVAPVSLSAGTTYVLGLYDDAVNTDQITFRQTVTLGNDIASIGAPLLLDGADLAFPTTPIGGNAEGFFGPDAMLSVSAVPEPSTWVLAGMGGLGCLLRFRRRKA